MQISARWPRRFSQLLLIFLILALAITACDDKEPELTVNLAAEQPTQLDSQSAQQVSSTFLDAWEKNDFATMYALISPNARDAFSQERFVGIYTDVDQLITIESLDYRINSVLVEGTTAIVDYEVDFVTQLMGNFNDPSADAVEPRIMRLITTPEGWRVAWSRNDIFSGWNSTAYLNIVRTPSQRGNIYDRNGAPLVVQNGVAIQLYLVRNRIPDELDCVAVLAETLRLDEVSLLEEINRYAPDIRFFIGEISQDSMTQNQERLESSCNVDTAPRSTRQYYERVAPHLLGYVGKIPAERRAEYEARGYSPDALVGLEGVEQAFESQLAGDIGLKLVLQSNAGYEIRTIAERPATPGQSVYLTIDRDLQLDVQWLLADAYSSATNTWAPGSPGASAVVMDVNTGEVLAIASYPDYDPGVFNPDTPILNPEEQVAEYSSDPDRPLLNRATQGRYPLGSVFKIFSSVAGLDSGVWSPVRTVNCTGIWYGQQFGADQKTDWLTTGHGVVNAESALTGSCNPFFWTLGVTLNQADPNILSDYVMEFGFGSAPPLQGVPTDAGLIPNPAWKLNQYGVDWTNADAANLVIGQGETAVNPLQVVRAVSAVANGGMLWDSLVVQKVQIIGQEPTEVYEPDGRLLDVDPNVLAQIRTAMCRVTSDPVVGTAQFIFNDDWRDIIQYSIDVCGKTGTAETGRKPHAWFAAYAPADNPEIAIVVIVENSCEGSEVAAPITRRIIEKYYDLDESYGWPDLWQYGCTQIGPGSGP